jgi:hypothetical protein
VTDSLLSLLKLGDMQLKRIYFQTTNFFKGSATANAWRMKRVLEPNKLIYCSDYLSLSSFLPYKGVHFALQFTPESKVTEAQLVKYTSESDFLLMDKILYTKSPWTKLSSNIHSSVALQPFVVL